MTAQPGLNSGIVKQITFTADTPFGENVTGRWIMVASAQNVVLTGLDGNPITIPSAQVGVTYPVFCTAVVSAGTGTVADVSVFE